jgi:hypothetical protein
VADPVGVAPVAPGFLDLLVGAVLSFFFGA